MVSGAVVALGATTVSAQSVESIMGARERLELTDQQVQQLDAIRRDAVAERNAERAQIAELQSQLQAGQIRRSQLMAAMEDQRDARQASAAQRRASLESVLTEAQRESVQQMRRRGARQRPAAGADRRGPGFGSRAGPGFGGGVRPGLGPVARRGFRPAPRVIGRR
jgi:hypothetical protein